MVIRSLVIATLFAGSASAHANPTSSTASMLGGLTLQSGSVSVVGALNSMDAIVASGNWAAFSQAWNMHTSLAAQGAASGHSAVLFAPNATGGMSGIGLAGGGAGGGGGVGVGADGGAGGGIGGGVGGGVGGSGGVGGGIGGGTDLDVPGIGAGVNLDVPGIGGNGGGGAAEIPEPGSIALLLAGLIGAGVMTRRRPR